MSAETTIVFIDQSVQEADIIASGAKPGTRLHRLEQNDFPLAKIASVLEGKRGVEKVALVTHGRPGEISICGARIGIPEIAASRLSLARIRKSLAPNAEILLIACAVGATPAGAEFVEEFERKLGARVTASTTDLGGDAGWSGLPAVAKLFGEQALAAYPHRLATFNMATISGTATLSTTADDGTTTLTATRSDGGNLRGENSGFLDPNSLTGPTQTYTLTFNEYVNISSIDIGEFIAGVNNGLNYTLTPDAGTAVTNVDTNFTGDVQTLSPTDWSTVQTITVSYAGSATYNLGVDNIVFTVVTRAATTQGANFNTSTGANLSPSFTFGTASETLTIASNSHVSGSTINGFGGTDTLILNDGVDISGVAVSNFENLTVDSGASVTMTVAQHDAFSGGIAGAGTNTITLSATGGDTATTGDADIENYLLGAGGITFTLGAAAQNLTGSSGADTVNVGTLTATGTLNGGAGTGDVLQLGTGANISGATVSGFETLTLSGGASVTMTEAQHDAFSTVTAPGADVITISAATDGFQTNSAVEQYILGVANATTITGAAQNITGSTGNDTFTFQGLTYTGTLSGGAGTDVIQMTTGSNISGATVTGVENLTLGSNASVTMTVSQLNTFAGGTITAGGTETVTLSGDGNVSTVSAIENYVVGDSTSNSRTVTITNAGHGVSATSDSDAVTFDAGALTLTGTLTGEGTVNDILSISNGANISGATISAIENLTISGNTGNATMTAAQLNGFTGTVTATGTNTLTLTSTGSITGADLSAIETIATAGGSSAQSITLSAAQAAGTTLTAGDSSLDSFVVTGSAGAQTVIGSAGSDTIDGGAGDDTISGGDGGDAIYGGDGADSLLGQNGADSLFGLSGDDFITGGAGDDTISGGDGNDSVVGGDGTDLLFGGAGNDTFSGTGAEFNGDTISGIAAGDQIIVTSDDLSALDGTTLGSTITTGGGTINIADATSGLTINASVSGGNTTLTFAAPASSGGSSGGGSSGGSGSSGPVVVTDDPSDTSTGGARTITNNGSTSGSAAIVQNTGNNGNIVTATVPPSVSISSEGPSSAQTSSEALSTLVTAIDNRDSSAENDLIGGARTYLNDLAATTTLDVRTIIPTTTSSSLSAPIVITGTSGGTQSEAFVIDLRSLPGGGGSLQLDNIEFTSIIGQATVTGGAGQNYVTADDNIQFISLGAEDDTLVGGGGNDTVGSAWGEDIVYGNQGADSVFGGGGMDTVYGGQDGDTVLGDNDNDWVYGNKGDDTLFGGNGDDLLFGGQDNDIVYGNTGNDSISGNLGSDTLYGGQGNDLISGGAGADILVGNKGDDTLSGGAGADTFIFEFGGGNDQVADFQAGTDTLALQNGLGVTSGVETNGNTVVTFSDGGTITVIGVSKTDLAAATGWELG